MRIQATVGKWSKRDVRDWCYKLTLTAQVEEDGEILALIYRLVREQKWDELRTVLHTIPDRVQSHESPIKAVSRAEECQGLGGTGPKCCSRAGKLNRYIYICPVGCNCHSEDRLEGET